jgi:hypothetical protein
MATRKNGQRQRPFRRGFPISGPPIPQDILEFDQEVRQFYATPREIQEYEHEIERVRREYGISEMSTGLRRIR